MTRFVCPSCGNRPSSVLKWLQTAHDESADGGQLLLAVDSQPVEADESKRPMATLRPCGHTYPESDLSELFELLDILEHLLVDHEIHDDRYTQQLLRSDIHSIARRLERTADRCVDRATVREHIADRHTTAEWLDETSRLGGPYRALEAH